MAGNLTWRCDLLHIAQVDKMGRQEAGYEGSEFSKWTTFTSVLASGENNSCFHRRTATGHLDIMGDTQTALNFAFASPGEINVN